MLELDFTLAFGRAASATKLVLGRWALNDRMFEALVSLERPAQHLGDSNVCFVEPLVGTLVSPAVRRLRPRFWSFEGTLRAIPLARRAGDNRMLEINFNKVSFPQSNSRLRQAEPLFATATMAAEPATVPRLLPQRQAMLRRAMRLLSRVSAAASGRRSAPIRGRKDGLPSRGERASVSGPTRLPLCARVPSRSHM